MNTVKKILAGILALTTLFSVGFAASCKDIGETVQHEAFIRELGGTSETYTGTVSSTTYATASQAIETCVANEVAGNKASVVNTTTTELSKEQVESLNIPASETEGMLGVDKVEVEYNVSAENAESNEKKTAQIYILKFANEYKYYTTRPANGEIVTQSYYNSVFDDENYTNCTLNSTMEINFDLRNGDETATTTIKMTQFAKYSENAIYLEQTTEMATETNAAEGTSSDSVSEKVWGYMAKNTTWNCYISRDGKNWDWTSLSSFGVYQMSELLPFASEKTTYSYFTKTDYGFELTNENARRYVQNTLGQLSAYLGEDSAMELFAKYYVCNGALSGMRMEMDIDVDYGNSTKVTGSITAVAESKVTDYGTTVVEKPFDLE